MKNVVVIGSDLEKFSNRLINNLKQAQRNTAESIHQHLVENSNFDTGAFVNSIQVENTKEEGGKISTFVGSDLLVTCKSGDSYNLGMLLETGTMPHAIPNAFGFGEEFGTDPNFHPGMKAYNNYRNALNFNINTYKENIKKAIKESKWGKQYKKS